MTQVAATGADRWQALYPEIVLAVTAMVILLLDSIWPRVRPRVHAVLAFGGIAGAAVAAAAQWDQGAGAALAEMVAVDRFGVGVRMVILLAAMLAVLMAPGYLAPRDMERSEFYSLLLLSTAGMTMLSVSTNLILVFINIELLSLAIYVLAGFDRSRLESQEAAMKYFLLGAFSSAFLLYGTAFVYGAAGTTNLLDLGALTGSASLESFRLVAVAAALLVVGLGFKVALVPFHMWTPDAYQGAPTPVTAFMAGGTKAAAFAALVRVFVVAMQDLRWDWRPPLVVLAAVTIVFASILAIAQTDLKRMLAYSSVAHAGFVALGVIAATRAGVASVLFYLAVYTVMTIGAFGCLMLFGGDGPERTHLAKFSGLGVRHPAAAALFALFLFALAGIPPTGGFFAKLHVFMAVVRAGYPWLAVVAVLGSVAAAFFYVRVAVVMFMQDPLEGDEQPTPSPAVGLRVALAICLVGVLASGVLPGPLLDLAQRAASFAPAGASPEPSAGGLRMGGNP
ncbi:MAG TPA: NADH-quinone oxidoreductase subunit N [Actinomycetota bacterium]|nr:NADH-quinone oxidoreductase subunit N [Actinomycetota bacterium]